MNFRASALVLFLGLLLCVGCGPDVSTYPVKGKVVYADDGSPVPKGLIEFAPLDDEGHSAIGAIKDDGTFTVTTSEGADGAAPGNYVVTVRVMEAPAGPAPDPDNPGADPALVTPAAAPKSLVHRKYQTPDTSDLKVEVKAESNDFTLKVERPE